MPRPARIGSAVRVPIGLAAGAGVLAGLLVLFATDLGGWRTRLRESTLDAVLRLAGPPAPAPLTVVDIDSATLARHGAWPWSRLALARLLDAVVAGGPQAVAVDILFAGTDRHSPAAVARDLAAETGRPDIAALVPSLPDGDTALAAAVARRPTALGAALEEVPTPAFEPVTPVLLDAPARLADPWRAVGASGPPAVVREAAQGLGVLGIENDLDGLVRRVPLLALAGETILPGLAVEAARLAEGASALVVDGGTLVIGAHSVPLGPDGRLRLRASSPAHWPARTVPAHRLLEDPAAAGALAGRIVLVGSSAVEVGALRRTPRAEAAPTLQIEADAVATLLSGAGIVRGSVLALAELAAALALGLAALALGRRTRPLVALAGGGLLACAWAAGAGAAVLGLNQAADPAGPALVGAATLGTALLADFIETERRERRLRRRFEQHLAPEVVARIAADPSSLKLSGEVREITALFTDVEGFTAMSERASPTALVAALDRYFDTVGEIVVAHGGMFDKIVGDAVHAFFNMPLDLPDHPAHALACACAIREATETLRREPGFAALGFGRTRIGIETGRAVVGDVGGRRKLDYTAHGMAINMASRLEAANKELGTSICIGPGAAARLPAGVVRRVAAITVRGVSHAVEVHVPAADPGPDQGPAGVPDPA
ncbi:adenylate/guanylate cyclase domain-containing protein [Xanthobacter sp. KR7-65]|uniref:CHASE2 domain-containing protein n=1 Tax=Xanthobacter sp. KR7-65 TaxID=3156612 RepID=UPI0032B5316D